MADGINRNNDDSIINVISSDGFSCLPDELQKITINSIRENREKDGGFMGKFFGIKKENAAMNIAVTICILLLLLCGIDVIHSIFSDDEMNMNLVNTIIPVISLALGFIFGKGSSKE